MKKLPVLILCVVVCTLFSCRYRDNNNLNLKVTDSDHYYSMDASFSKRKTKAVERYMDSRIRRKSNISFKNSRINGLVSLDDQTVVFIKKSPGILKIKLDKDENTEEALMRVRSMCEGIKEVLVR